MFTAGIILGFAAGVSTSLYVAIKHSGIWARAIKWAIGL